MKTEQLHITNKQSKQSRSRGGEDAHCSPKRQLSLVPIEKNLAREESIGGEPAR